MSQRPDDRTLRRDLRASTGDAAAFSLMVGLGETYLPAFVLALGLGEVFAGLTATVPMLAGATLQLISPAAVRRLHSHRRWVVLCCTLQGLSFAPLIVAALVGRISGLAVLAIATLYWGAGMAAGPAWNTWIGRIVPPHIRPRFFAMRTRIAQACVLIGLLLGGAALDRAADRGAPLTGFAILFVAAGCARLLSASFLASQSEPAPPATRAPPTPARGPATRLAPPGRRLLLYMLGVQATAQLAAPYFTPYLLSELALPYFTYVALLAAAFLAKILALPTLGRLVYRHGARRVLLAGGVGIVPLSALWLFSPSIPYLLGLQLVGGVAWAAYELATFLLLFETIPDRERTSVLTTFNLVHAAATVTGSVTGGLILRWAGEERAAYLLVFLLSTVGRLLTLLLLRRVGAVPPVPANDGRSTLAARPSAGSIDRPILPTIPAASPDKPTEESAS